jgi:hypothetical protein
MKKLLFHGNQELPQKGCKFLLLKKCFENFKGFHPILYDQNIIKIVLSLYSLVVVVVVVVAAVVVVVNFCVSHLHTNFAWQDKILMQFEEIILMETCRYVIFSAIHTNKAAQFYINAQVQ